MKLFYAVTTLGSCLCAVLVRSCATTGPTHPVADAPTCTGEADCAVKWSAARTFVLSHAGYKIQTYSPDFMQTYNPINSDLSLGAEV